MRKKTFSCQEKFASKAQEILTAIKHQYFNQKSKRKKKNQSSLSKDLSTMKNGSTKAKRNGKIGSGKDPVFVGIHNRRGDHLQYQQVRLNQQPNYSIKYFVRPSIGHSLPVVTVGSLSASRSSKHLLFNDIFCQLYVLVNSDGIH